MPAPSLATLCMKACIKNAPNLRDIGNFEYWKIRPALLRITNPKQLHEIELASPQILGEDAELWKAFMARDIPSSKLIKDLKPDDPLKWWELYSEYLEEEHKAIERDTETLRVAMKGIQKVKEKNVSKVMAAKYLPKQPKDPRMLANNGGVPISLREWKRESVPRRAKDSSKIFTKARREAKEISSRTRFNVSPQRLPVGTPQVLKAPKSMLADYRRAVVPEQMICPTLEIAPKTSTIQSLSEREKRLRALTASSYITKSASKGEDSSEHDLDDLFGERKSYSVSPPPKKSISSRRTQLSTTARPTQATRSVPNLRRLPPAQSKDARPINATPAIFEENRKSSPPTRTVTELEPSDIISSIISRPKSEQSSPTQKAPSTGQSTSSPSRLNSPTSADITTTTPPRKGSPPGRLSKPPPGAMIRKRVAEVDIFNRTGTATKRPRVK